jgi:hypothetical protein
MKKTLLLFILQFTLATTCYSQNIQEYFEELKTDIQLKLDSCRTNERLGNWYSRYLKSVIIDYLAYHNKMFLSEYFDVLSNKADSINPESDWKSIYDDKMINRMIQLLNNEYREDELETLVSRKVALFSQNAGLEQRAMIIMMVDTSRFFLSVQDSLNTHRDKEIHPELYQNFDVFLYMKLDTTAQFRMALDSVKKSIHESVVNYYLSEYHFDIYSLIEACSYINDKRFIQPLIKIIDKYNKDNVTIHALVRMRVEPYRTELLTKLTLSTEEIKKLEFAGNVYYLEFFGDDPDYLLELSKYLLSDANTLFTSAMGACGTAYIVPYKAIKQYLENKSLWNILNKHDFDLEKDRFKIYEWMQQNYGNYRIKKYSNYN